MYIYVDDLNLMRCYVVWLNDNDESIHFDAKQCVFVFVRVCLCLDMRFAVMLTEKLAIEK